MPVISSKASGSQSRGIGRLSVPVTGWQLDNLSVVGERLVFGGKPAGTGAVPVLKSYGELNGWSPSGAPFGLRVARSVLMSGYLFRAGMIP